MKMYGEVDVQIHVFLTIDTSLRRVVCCTSRPLNPRRNSPLPMVLIGWAPEPVWMTWRQKKFLALPGLELWLFGHPVCSQALYWPCYSSSLKMYVYIYIYMGAHGTIVVKALCYKPKGRGFETRWGEWIFPIHLIIQAALGLGVYSASNRNEYQKQENNVSAEQSAAGA
jgi:hypothetical protein